MQLIDKSKNKLKPVFSRLKKQADAGMYGSCAVLLYHRITNLETDPQLLSVTPENFDAHLSCLKKHYTVLQIEELQFYIEMKKKLPKKSIAITFDDGYADNFLEALPILESNNLQALFYISTGNLNTANEFWWDAMERIVLLNGNSPAENKFSLNDKFFDLNEFDPGKRFALYKESLPILSKMVSRDREKKINKLAEILNSFLSRASHRSLTFDELKKMSASKHVVIGAHTHLHPSLAALNYDEQLNEIKLSKEILEREIEKPVIHFSFPFGTKEDFNKDTLNICRQLKFEMAAANYPCIVNQKTNIMQYPRFLVRNWNEKVFKINLNSFFQ